MKVKKILLKIKENKSPKQLKNLIEEGFERRLKRLCKPMLKGHKPDFLIIGAQKSGTTALYHYLNQHQQLTRSIPKEIHYFDKWINYGYDINWYEKHFISFLSNFQLYYESSPNYIYYERVAQQIAKYYPEIKLILVLRNPVERTVSAYNMYQSFFRTNKNFFKDRQQYPGIKNPIHKLYFEKRNLFPNLMEAVEIELNEAIPMGYDEPSILRRGLYATQIKTYLKFFKRDQLLVIGSKDLKTNTQKTLKQITDYLNIQPFNFEELVITPRNKGKYKNSINEKDILFLNEYFKNANEELFNLLGKEIYW